jgi:DNA-binding MarR family transcriptional regulator
MEMEKLEDAAMVQRKVDENNRRKNIITVTEKGRTSVDNIRKMDNNGRKASVLYLQMK